jgi:tetratricopeptide (TPR) repeat protein
VPWDVTQTIQQRLAALSDAARDLLASVAVAGSAVSGSILTQMIDWPPAEVLDAIEGACRARLLVSASEDVYEFAHDLITDVVAANLSARRRKVLHERMARALERAPGEPPVEQLAYHYGRAGDIVKEIEYLERAGDRMRSRHAHADAERSYRELVTRLEGGGLVADLARARYKLAGALLDTAQLDQVVEQCERAAAAYQALGEYEAYAETLARAAHAYSLLGEPDKALICLQHGLAAAATLTPVTLAQLDVQLTYAFARMGRAEEALAAAEQACEHTRSAGESALLHHAQMRRGYLLGTLGRLEEARQALEDVLALERDPRDDGNILCSTLMHLCVTCMSLGEYGPSMRYAERGLEIAERLANPTLALMARSNRGWAAYLLGDWERARADLEPVVALTLQMPASWATPYPILNLGIMRLAQGQQAASMEHIERGLALAEQAKDRQLVRWLHQELAEADLLAGQAEEAHARLAPLLDQEDPKRVSGQAIDAVALLPFLAWASVQLGDEEKAEALLAQCLNRAEAAALRPTVVAALRVESLLAMQQRHTLAAEAALERALNLARAMSSPYDEAKTLYTHAMLHVQRGDLQQARARLQDALVVCTRLGERLYAERAEQMLGQLR